MFLLTEDLKKNVKIGIEVDQEFKQEYNDLDNAETITFVKGLKNAVSAIFVLYLKRNKKFAVK